MNLMRSLSSTREFCRPRGLTKLLIWIDPRAYAAGLLSAAATRLIDADDLRIAKQ